MMVPPVTIEDMQTVVNVLNECVPQAWGEVVDFITQYAGLPNVVQDTCDHVRRAFGAGVQLSLRLMNDPEGDFTQLFLVVGGVADSSAAFSSICKLDEDWLLTLPSRLRMLFNVTLE
jgi:hypothetical protein